MPMAISKLDEYDKVVNVSWYTPDKSREDLRYIGRPFRRRGLIELNRTRFPCVLPFSQMYPLCCIDIRNFLNQFHFFSDDHFEHSRVIDDNLKAV